MPTWRIAWTCLWIVHASFESSKDFKTRWSSCSFRFFRFLPIASILLLMEHSCIVALCLGPLDLKHKFLWSLNHQRPFDIGIYQDSNPIDFFPRKINAAQQRYPASHKKPCVSRNSFKSTGTSCTVQRSSSRSIIKTWFDVTWSHRVYYIGACWSKNMHQR